jgi:hypothetical protein
VGILAFRETDGGFVFLFFLVVRRSVMRMRFLQLEIILYGLFWLLKTLGFCRFVGARAMFVLPCRKVVVMIVITSQRLGIR